MLLRARSMDRTAPAKNLLLPFPMANTQKVEMVRERLTRKLAYKPAYEVNFVMSQQGAICCFDGKIIYVTDGNLRPLLYYESNSYINACTISDRAGYILFQMAYNKEMDEDDGATALFDVRAKRLVARRQIETGWKGTNGLYIDEQVRAVWVYCDDKKVRYDFCLALC